jgi:hypothetical protein
MRRLVFAAGRRATRAQVTSSFRRRSGRTFRIPPQFEEHNASAVVATGKGGSIGTQDHEQRRGRVRLPAIRRLAKFTSDNPSSSFGTGVHFLAE